MSDNPLSGGGLLNSIAHPTMLSSNFLAAYGQGQEAARQVWANRLSQAQQAAGQAQQGAINPTTGEYDPNAARANLAAAGPQAALAAQSMLGANQSISADQLNQAHQKATWINNTAGAALQQGDYSDAAMLGLLNQGVASGMINLTEAQRQLASMPPDAAGRRAWLQQHQMTSASTQEQLAQTYGTPLTVSTGQAVQPGRQLPASQGGGFVPGGAPVQQYPSRSELLTQQPGAVTSGPNAGAPTVTPLATRAGDQGRSDLTGPAGQPPPPGPNNPPRLGTPGVPAGAAVTGPAPSATTGNAADVTAYKTAQAGVPIANNSVQNLQHAYQALQLTNAGKSTETTHAMYSFLAAQGLLPQGLVDDVKNYDLFRKYTERYAADQGQVSNTDAGRAMAVAANAGTSISTPANNDVLRNEIGRQRQAIAQVQAHSDQSGVGYGAHVARFSSATDPRGFSADMYSPAELVRMEAGMKGPEKDRFFASIAMANRMGLFNRAAQ